jgi:hypothetical protein
MLSTDLKALNKEMGRVASATKRTIARTVKSMALNAKDRLLVAIGKFDRPTPYMLCKGAYMVGNPEKKDGGYQSSFIIMPDQAAVLEDDLQSPYKSSRFARLSNGLTSLRSNRVPYSVPYSFSRSVREPLVLNPLALTPKLRLSGDGSGEN